MARMKSVRALWIAFAAVLTVNVAGVAESNAGCYENGPPRIVHRSFVHRDIEDLGPLSGEPRPFPLRLAQQGGQSARPGDLA